MRFSESFCFNWKSSLVTLSWSVRIWTAPPDLDRSQSPFYFIPQENMWISQKKFHKTGLFLRASVESANHALLALCFNKTKISFHCRKQTVREEKRKEDLFLVKLVTKRAGRYNVKKELSSWNSLQKKELSSWNSLQLRELLPSFKLLSAESAVSIDSWDIWKILEENDEWQEDDA